MSKYRFLFFNQRDLYKQYETSPNRYWLCLYFLENERENIHFERDLFIKIVPIYLGTLLLLMITRPQFFYIFL